MASTVAVIIPPITPVPMALRLLAPTKRQNYADGGVVGAIKGMFGIKPEDPERARRLAEYQANG